MDPVARAAAALPPSPASPPRLAPSMRGVPVDVARTARDFESVFIGQVTKIMMESATGGGDLPGGHGEEMFRDIMAEEMGKSIAQRGGLGLAPSVAAQIIRMQGGSADGR
ncbi:flagellar biosynthesis protein FlgJ [Sphingomonas sp. AP4-R1]|uniref:rod-binding protein n=1 Tax=Sphingomonas sp. AP4-R1 TaxID=2735134 RepID=UPI00149382C8|nr:rod-binding protein [Sphingomonas sp. AP4-R1]QJU57420.1 flagellar biosynthesis protein FlgJ [Sphingomonas sp. AP4-R1]